MVSKRFKNPRGRRKFQPQPRPKPERPAEPKPKTLEALISHLVENPPSPEEVDRVVPNFVKLLPDSRLLTPKNLAPLITPKTPNERHIASMLRQRLLAGTSLSDLSHPGRRLRRNPLTGTIVGVDYKEVYGEYPEHPVKSGIVERAKRIGTSLANVGSIAIKPLLYLRDRRVLKEHARQTGMTFRYIDKRRKLIRIRDDLLAAIHAQTGILPSHAYSRVKRWYSMSKSAARRRVPGGPRDITKVRDALGLRFIVKNEKECFKVANFLMSIPHPEGTIAEGKNYIRRPRAGAYRGIHVIRRIGGELVEIQIRTPKMLEETKKMDRLLGRYGRNKLSRDRLNKRIVKLYDKFEGIEKRTEQTIPTIRESKSHEIDREVNELRKKRSNTIKKIDHLLYLINQEGCRIPELENRIAMHMAQERGNRPNLKTRRITKIRDIERAKFKRELERQREVEERETERMIDELKKRREAEIAASIEQQIRRQHELESRQKIESFQNFCLNTLPSIGMRKAPRYYSLVIDILNNSGMLKNHEAEELRSWIKQGMPSH